jgi:hypothetical protein
MADEARRVCFALEIESKRAEILEGSGALGDRGDVELEGKKEGESAVAFVVARLETVGAVLLLAGEGGVMSDIAD